MGGDYGPPVTVPAAMDALANHPDLSLMLVGDEAVLRETLSTFSYDPRRLTVLHASERVGMDESPASALRNKKDSSMRVAINQVKEGVAGACVSAGNTGALMAIGKFVLKTLPGIDRPAIISAFPTANRHKKVRILDLGANVDSRAEHLVQFAVMGSLLASAVDNIKVPKVYLLNIGAEAIKGNEQVRQTAQLLANVSAIHYAGFIEGDGIYQGHADVVVCDGFVGNVALKTTEGVANFVRDLINDAFRRNWATKLAGLMVKPILKDFVKRIDPALYNGATFIGLKGTVIKSHGGAKISAFAHAIEEAMIEVEKNVTTRLQQDIETILKQPLSPQDE